MLHHSLEYIGALRGGNASLLLLLVKATIILIGALLVTVAMRRTAAGARHMVWLVTLGALLLVPALTVWAPLRFRVLPAQTAVVDATVAAPVESTVASRTRDVIPIGVTDRTAVPTVQSIAESRSTVLASSLALLRNSNPLIILFAIWAAVAIAIAASLVYAALTLRRVVRGGRPLNDQDWLNTIWEVSDRLGLDRTPRLLRSGETKMPFACGLLHPTIVLPAESDEWSPERRRAVLLHELAHIRRHDLIGHTLGRVACAVYWFHPLVWTAARRLRSESERACDNLALSCGTRAADYAEHLLDIVISVRRDRTPLIALAMARRSEFEGRMLAILDPELQRSTPSRWKSGVLVCSLGVMSIVVGAAAPMPRAAAQLQATATHGNVTAPELPTRILPARNTAIETGSQVSRFATHVTSSVLSRLDGAMSAPAGIASGSITVPVVTAVGNANFSFDGPAAEKRPGERAVLLARVLSTDTSASLRQIAAWGLAQYADSAVASTALASALQHDASSRVRETAAWALGRNSKASSATVAALVATVRRDASDSVRATAAWALGVSGDAAATEALTAALADQSAAVRTRAIWALGRIRPRHVPSALTAKLGDRDPKVREMAAWALYTIRDPASIPALQTALHNETDKDLQIADIHALTAMGDQSTDALRGLLESPDARTKSIAVQALAGGSAMGPWPWPWPDPRPFP